MRLITMILAFATAVLLAVQAEAAQTKSDITMLINERGTVEVVDRWRGMLQEFGVYNYMTFAREVGTVPVEINDGGFTLSFATRSYLRYEDGVYNFVTPDFFYADGPVDVNLALTYPPNLVLLDAEPAPSYTGDGVLSWTLPDCSHQLVHVTFERVGPFVQPGMAGPDYQVDPRTLAMLAGDDLPKSADEVLKELENIIKVAKASEATDPDFLKVMDRLLAKFYYIFDINGLLLDYDPPQERERDKPEAAGPVEDDPGDGLIQSGSGAVSRRSSD